MEELHIILDAGHGGLNAEGKYTTCLNWDPSNSKTWKKMWVHEGIPFYEGVFNRQIVNRLAAKLDQFYSDGISYTNLNVYLGDEEADHSLDDRTEAANKIYKDFPNAIYVSIHGNAFNETAYGFEVFSSPGATTSDKLAELYNKALKNILPSAKARGVKEANFKVLRDTKMPAVLTENGFFDNPKNAELMKSNEGQEAIAQIHLNMILSFKELYL